MAFTELILLTGRVTDVLSTINQGQRHTGKSPCVFPFCTRETCRRLDPQDCAVLGLGEKLRFQWTEADVEIHDWPMS